MSRAGPRSWLPLSARQVNVRHPADLAALRSQNATLKRGQHAKYPPHAFTEHGAIMAAMVLNSPQAVAMSV
ncbi:MAG: hypothetical protein EPO27_15145 [Betaproteobacteria bacterium]|nr:MAG: hypothetical protein EPO27_15145 [Betaproteobacteria bacterium]